MARSTFTDEQAREMREKYEEGATLYQLVAEYGSWPTTISRTITRVGGSIRPPGYLPGEKDKSKPPRGLLGWVNT